MKRFSKTLAAALIIVATAAAFMVGCKKEQMPEAIEAREDETTLARIMDFKCQLEAVEATPNEKTAAYMSVADAVWNVEALFNFTYAYPDETYSQTVSCDTTLNLYVCANDSVLLSDLSAFYGQMFTAVQTLYQAVDLDDKQFLILDVEAGERHGSLQAVTLHTIQGSVTSTPQPSPDPPQPWRGPFTNGLTWYYGKNGGTSNGQFQGTMDAADTLTRTLNARLVPQAPENCEYYYTNILGKTSQQPVIYPFSHDWFPNIASHHCEFYRANPTPDDYWLDPDLMNFHYYGECQLVLVEFRNGEDPVPSTHSLFQVRVWDYDTDTVIGHHTEALYGIRGVVAHEWGDREHL